MPEFVIWAPIPTWERRVQVRHQEAPHEQVVWIARESYCEEHAFIGVFESADAAKAACDEYHAEFIKYFDPGQVVWGVYNDIFHGSSNHTGYVVHAATVGQRWKR